MGNWKDFLAAEPPRKKNLCEASFESLRLLTFDIVATRSLSHHGEAVSRISCRLLLWSSVSFPHGV